MKPMDLSGYARAVEALTGGGWEMVTDVLRVAEFSSLTTTIDGMTAWQVHGFSGNLMGF